MTSDLDAAMFFGRIDLYSDHWVTSRILVLAGLPGTIFRLALQNRLGELLQRLSSIESSPGCDLLRVLNGRYTNLSYQKTWRRSNLSHFRSFELILTANIPQLLPRSYLD